MESWNDEPPRPRQSPRHWIVKFASFRTSWEQIVRNGSFTLRGVRSCQARRNLSLMSLGDFVFFYRSQQDQAIVGLMTVVRTAYSDPTSGDPQWLTCDFKPIKTLSRSVVLPQLRKNKPLSEIVRQPRLAVAPIASHAFEEILRLAGESMSSLSSANPQPRNLEYGAAPALKALDL